MNASRYMAMALLSFAVSGCTHVESPAQAAPGVTPGKLTQTPLPPNACELPPEQQDSEASVICQRLNRTLDGVQFPPGKSVLDLASRQALDELIEDLGTYTQFSIRIEAHTDNRGSARENLALSKDRALAVVRYLIVNGVDGRRLHPYGFGEARPRVSNETAADRARNRRIEIKTLAMEELQ